jgi:hypothetical protein
VITMKSLVPFFEKVKKKTKCYWAFLTLLLLFYDKIEAYKFQLHVRLFALILICELRGVVNDKSSEGENLKKNKEEIIQESRKLKDLICFYISATSSLPQVYLKELTQVFLDFFLLSYLSYRSCYLRRRLWIFSTFLALKFSIKSRTKTVLSSLLRDATIL